MLLESFLFLVFLHFVADFPMQGSYLAMTKGKMFYSLIAHSIIYAGILSCGLYLLGIYAIWKSVVLLVSHVVIDYWKSRAKNIEKQNGIYLYIDQVLHIGINTALLLM